MAFGPARATPGSRAPSAALLRRGRYGGRRGAQSRGPGGVPGWQARAQEAPGRASPGDADGRGPGPGVTPHTRCARGAADGSCAGPLGADGPAACDRTARVRGEVSGESPRTLSVRLAKAQWLTTVPRAPCKDSVHSWRLKKKDS